MIFIPITTENLQYGKTTRYPTNRLCTVSLDVNSYPTSTVSQLAVQTVHSLQRSYIQNTTHAAFCKVFYKGHME